MKVHPFYNGKAYGWGRLRSLFDFFFPYKQWHDDKNFWKWDWNKRRFIQYKTSIIRAEASTAFKQGRVVSRNFYTFRAFTVHYWNTLIVWKLRELASVELRVAEMLLAPGITLPVGIYFAIATDTGTFSGFATSNNMTFAQTCTGANGILFVGSYEAGTLTSNWTSTAYAGTNMNVSNTSSIGGASGYFGRHEFLAPPATGTNNVVVSWSSAGTQHEGEAFSYSGALATSTIDNSHVDTASNTGTFTLTSAVTPVADNCWVNGFFWSNGAMGSGDVITGTYREDAADSTLMCDNNGPQHPAASVTLACRQTSTGSRTIKSVLSSFAPAVAVTTNIEWSHPTNQPSSHWNQNIGFS